MAAVNSSHLHSQHTLRPCKFVAPDFLSSRDILSIHGDKKTGGCRFILRFRVLSDGCLVETCDVQPYSYE